MGKNLTDGSVEAMIEGEHGGRGGGGSGWIMEEGIEEGWFLLELAGWSRSIPGQRGGEGAVVARAFF